MLISQHVGGVPGMADGVWGWPHSFMPLARIPGALLQGGLPELVRWLSRAWLAAFSWRPRKPEAALLVLDVETRRATSAARSEIFFSI